MRFEGRCELEWLPPDHVSTACVTSITAARAPCPRVTAARRTPAAPSLLQ